MYPAYDAHHRLRTIRWNIIQPIQNPSEWPEPRIIPDYHSRSSLNMEPDTTQPLNGLWFPVSGTVDINNRAIVVYVIQILIPWWYKF